MKILFIHQNFPGQFRQLAPALAAAGHEVHALAIAEHGAPGVVLHRYGVKAPAPGEAGPHPWLRDAQAKVLRGQAAMQRVSRPSLPCILSAQLPGSQAGARVRRGGAGRLSPRDP